MATSRASDAERMFDLHEDDIALVTLAMLVPFTFTFTVLSCSSRASSAPPPPQKKRKKREFPPVQFSCGKQTVRLGCEGGGCAGDGAWQRAVIAR